MLVDLGSFPKHTKHLIVDLCHPQGNSVYDGIPKELCSMTYITIDDVIQKIVPLSPEVLFANINIRTLFA